MAIQWLSSALVQGSIHQLCEDTLASSLDVERRLGQVKQWETSRSTNIATASRNMLIVRYAKQRERLAQDLAAAMQKFRRAQRTNRQSLTFGGLTSTSFQVAPTPQKKLCTERPTPQKKLCTAREHGARADGARAEGEQGLAARKEALLAKAEAEVEDILSKCDLPITRLQWAAWLDDHIVEFHGRMKTESVRRRALNTRVRARENLPEPAVRLHPKSGAKAKYTTQWAANLAGRCGWHGLQTNTCKMMVVLMSNGGVTYYIDLEPNRVAPDVVSYALTCDFDLGSQLHPLADLDAQHADRDVRGAYTFEVEAKATADGNGARVIVWPARGCRITAPLPKPKRRTDTAQGEECDTDEEEEKIMEDVLGQGNEDAVSESSDVIDTAAESVKSCCSSSNSGSEDDPGRAEKAPADAAAALPTAHGDGARVPRVHKAPLWDNGYFYIIDNTGVDETVKIVMHRGWSHAPPGGMGDRQTSKTLTPAHYGETRENPQRSWLLLRAWMLWRARANDWVSADRGRLRHFDEEVLVLERRIKGMSEPGSLLCNQMAAAKLKVWVPDIAARLCGSGGS